MAGIVWFVIGAFIGSLAGFVLSAVLHRARCEECRDEMRRDLGGFREHRYFI